MQNKSSIIAAARFYFAAVYFIIAAAGFMPEAIHFEIAAGEFNPAAEGIYNAATGFIAAAAQLLFSADARFFQMNELPCCILKYKSYINSIP
ncbi:MAG: hypothetical protein HZC28_06470 [Spirochaetes bacterium]|nr:hypothetical protein [Spirochaetota bacterium]